MTMPNTDSLKHLADDELLAQTKQLVERSNNLLARLLVHLAEVEQRGLHLKLGFSSMFRYCVEMLGFSEAAAYIRIRGCRLIRSYPMILPLVASGKLHLSGLALLSPHLTPKNHPKLLWAACGKSKRAIEALVASRFPRPAVESRIRRLPKQKTGPSQAPELLGLLGAHRSTGIPNPSTSAAPRAQNLPSEPTSSPATTNARRDQVSHLATNRFKIQFTANQKLVSKLSNARSLLSHRHPNAELNTIFELALDLLCEALMKQRFAKTKRARKTKPATTRGKAWSPVVDTTLAGKSNREHTAQPEKPNPTTATPFTTPITRHIPNQIKRVVLARDGAQCTFKSKDGRRCGERHFLEFHHCEPFGYGGKHSVENITILCRAHNTLLARPSG